MSVRPVQEPTELRTAIVWANLASGMGALVLGVGLGIFVGELLRARAAAIVVWGSALHAWGMFRKHRLERELLGPPPTWSVALNLVCWLLVLLLVGLLSLAA